MSARYRGRGRVLPKRRHPPHRPSAAGRELNRPALKRGAVLGPLTTLGIGGPAWALARFRDAEELSWLAAEAKANGRPLLVLGGGSNVVIPDEGLRALVVQSADRKIEVSGSRLRAGAGAAWDQVVSTAVAEGLQGIEALSGIPGSAGAAPIQNIGAYGQELADCLVEVEVWDPESGRRRRMARNELGLGYRTSRFKRGDPGVVLGLTLQLARVVPRPSYEELQTAVGALPEAVGPALARVRATVLRIRRRKSMVWDPDDPNHRSVGSFFMNPVVDDEQWASVREQADRLGRPGPRAFPAPGGHKLSAAWLIEQAGFGKGHREGNVGLSTRHSLALVAHEGASAQEIERFAVRIQARVRSFWGVELEPEARFL